MSLAHQVARGPAPRRLSPPRRLLAVSAFYTALTAFMIWPWPARLADSLAGIPGDGQYDMWLIGWYLEALLKLGVSPFFVPWLNFPEGYALAYTEMIPGSAAVARPVTLLLGPLVAYNGALYLSLVLAGVAVYLWAYRAGRSHSRRAPRRRGVHVHA